MHRKTKTRTTIIDGPPSRDMRKLDQTRRDVAAEAAKIMATEGQCNYRAAKQKAALRIGVSSRLTLPSNKQVETALRDYQGVFGGERHFRHLEVLRSAALKVMRALDCYCPRLVGPVLEGTADRHSRVSLHLFNDPPDAIALHLEDRGLSYSQEERKIRWHDGSYKRVPILITDADGVAIELALFRSIDLRQAPPSPVDGKPQKRAPLAEVECLLAGV